MHGLLFLLLLHLFPRRARERLLIAAFRQFTAAAATAALPPPSLTSSAVRLTPAAAASHNLQHQQQSLQGDGSTRGRAGSRASASLSAATAAALGSEMDQLCRICRAPEGSAAAKGAEKTSLFGTGDISGKAPSGSEQGSFALLTSSPVIGVSSAEVEFLPSCCPLPRDAVAPAIAALVRMGEAAAELASTWTAQQPLAPQPGDESGGKKSLPNGGVKGTVVSGSILAERGRGRGDGGEVEAAAIASACAPAASHLSVLLLYQQDTLHSDTEFMHAFVRNLLSFSPPPTPKPKTWSLLAPAPTADAQPMDGRPSAPSWMVPVGLGFVLDLVVTWQGFAAASSALGKHVSGGLVSEAAARLAVGVSGLRRRVKRTYMWLKEEAEEEEVGDADDEGGDAEESERESKEGSIEEQRFRDTGHELAQVQRGAGLHGLRGRSSMLQEHSDEEPSVCSNSFHPAPSSQAHDTAPGNQESRRRGGRVRGLPVLRETRRVLSLIRASHAVCRWLLLHRSAALPSLKQAVRAADAALASALTGHGSGGGGASSMGGGYPVTPGDWAFPSLSPLPPVTGRKDTQHSSTPVHASQPMPVSNPPGPQAGSSQPKGADGVTGEGLRAVLCLLLEASKLAVLASEQLRVLVARRADSWQCLAATAAAQLATVAAELDWWRGGRDGGAPIGREEGWGRGEERGGEDAVGRSGSDGHRQQWRPSTGESVSQWFVRLSRLVSLRASTRGAMECRAVHISVVWCRAEQCSSVRCGAVWCRAVLCREEQSSEMQCMAQFVAHGITNLWLLQHGERTHPWM